MVDFKKLREHKNKQTVLKPTDIFRRLPKPSGINDLYTSQAEVLEQWFGISVIRFNGGLTQSLLWPS